MISLICAQDRNGLIGLNGTIPWHRPEDLKNFKRLTIGHAVVMGRKTFESIGRPLPDRANFILTSDPMSIDQTNLTLSISKPENLINGYHIFKKEFDDNIDLFIIGGMKVYKSFASYIERMYITVIDQYTPIPDREFEAIYFPWPSFSGSSWSCVEQGRLGQDFYYVYDKVVTYVNTSAKKG